MASPALGEEPQEGTGRHKPHDLDRIVQNHLLRSRQSRHHTSLTFGPTRNGEPETPRVIAQARVRSQRAVSVASNACISGLVGSPPGLAARTPIGSYVNMRDPLDAPGGLQADRRSADRSKANIRAWGRGHRRDIQRIKFRVSGLQVRSRARECQRRTHGFGVAAHVV